MENLTITTPNSEIDKSNLSNILTTLTKNVAIVESDIGNQNIIFNNLSEDVYVMNVTAKIIWHNLTEGAQIEDILKSLEIWFTNGINQEEAIGDIKNYVQKLEEEGLIYLRNNKDEGGFPIGKEINITQNRSDVKYQPPTLIKYNRAKLKEKHPEIFYKTQFSDTWGPEDDSWQ